MTRVELLIELVDLACGNEFWVIKLVSMSGSDSLLVTAPQNEHVPILKFKFYFVIDNTFDLVKTNYIYALALSWGKLLF